MYIKTILQKDEIVFRQLKGVFAANDLFYPNISNGLYILNTDEKGSHWCVFYLTTILPNFSILWVSLQSFITPILEIILLHRIDPTNIFVNNFKAPILMFIMNDN